MKYIIITDTHFGTKNNSLFWCSKQMDFLDTVLIPYLENETSPWKLVHLGDVFDSRAVVSSKIVDEVDKRFAKINDICVKTGNEMIIIGGNHDYFSPENDSVSFLNILLRNYSAITLLTRQSMVLQSDVSDDFDLFMPWYEFNEIETLKSKLNTISERGGKVKRIFTHTDCNFNSEYSELLNNITVYAGHIHRPYNKNIWHNLGSTFAKDFNDANRRPGAYILNDDNVIEMLYNDVSIRFWKYSRVPLETDALTWHSYDKISIYITSEMYEQNIETIKKIKETYDVTITVCPAVINEDIKVNQNLDIEEICKQSIPKEYTSMFNEVLKISKTEQV